VLIPKPVSFPGIKARAEASTQGLLIMRISPHFLTQQMARLYLVAYFGVKDAVSMFLNTSLTAHLNDCCLVIT